MMSGIEKILEGIKQNPKHVRFIDVCKVCEFYFGKHRQQGTSHRIYKTPWQGDPRINIQNNKGRAKYYQVKQVLRAIELLGIEHEHQK